MKKFLLLFFTFLSINFIYSQATCATMSPICSGNISPQPSLVGIPSLGSPGCLGSAPNPNWYTFQTGFAGTLIFNLHQGNNPPLYNNTDIDFICWGPFTDAQMASTACNSLADLTAPVNPNNIVACSFSAAAVETITIPNANPGSNYILLITNYSNSVGQFVMEQTNSSSPGSGSTNCDVVCGVDLGPTATSVYPSPPATNTISFCNSVINSQTLHCNFQNPPANQNTLAYQWFLNGVLQPTLTTKSITVTQSGTWKVKVTHPDCGTPTEDSVIIYFGATPVVNAIPTQLGPIGDCNPTFDLTSLIPALLAPLNPADFTVSFFTDYGASLIYTDPVTGQIPNPSTFQTNVDTTIWVRARNNTSPQCVDSEEISFLLDVRCTNNATAVGNTICTNNTGQLTFTGPPSAVVTFTQGANTYNVTLPASGTFIWNTPSPLTSTTVYTLTNVTVGSVITPLTGNTATITVTSANTASTPSATPTLCINTALTAITHTTTGATGIGTATGLPAGVTATWASDTITISGTPSASGTFAYSIPLTGGCGTVNATGSITVTPTNTASAPSATPTLCVNTALTAITHTTTGATGIGTATGLPAGVTATWASDTITISGTPSASGTFAYSIPLTGGCGTVNAIGSITVISINTVTAGTTNPVFCINTAIPALTHTTTGATGIGTATGLPAGVTATWASNTITISGTPTASGTFAYSIPLTGGCGTVNATGSITVTTTNTAAAPSATPTLCVNTALTAITHTTTGATGIGTAIGLPAGVTATWAANTITISGTPSASGTFAYTIPLTGGCGTVNATGSITVTTTNTASTPSATPTLCINTALTAITHTTTGATGIGTATGLPAGVTATWASNTITISGTPSASGTFTYSIPLTGGCGTVNATGSITVAPINTVTAGTTNPVFCINTAIPALTHTTTGATGIGTATGLPAGVTATWATNTITISGTPSASGTFAYSIPLTGGCGTVNATGSITVTTTNTASAPSATPTLCINTALTAITHTTTGATGIGTATGLPAGVTATWASNTITISGTPTASGVFAYSIPLTGGCGTVNATGSITVTTANTASAPSATPTLCINTALTAITHTTTGATGIGTATGLPAGVTATWASNTITISGTPSASGTFAYTIPLTGGCGTVNATGSITVTTTNTASTPSATPTLCINTALTAITHTTTGATGIGTATGLPAGVTAIWASNTITISGTPTASGTFAYSIPLTGGCGTVNATGSITVTTANTAAAPSATPTLCINTALTAITHTTTGATGIGTATGLPAGVTATWASNTITISGTPTASGTFAYSIPLTGGCGTVNATGSITVTPTNTAAAPSATPTLCVNTALTAITHTTTGATGIGTATGLPAGVTATWASDTITISGTPSASGTFTYSIPLTGGCGTVNATGSITVNQDNTVTVPSATPTLCINTALTAITHTTTGATGIGTATGLPAGVTATWASDTITISGTPSASGTFAYSIPLTGGCNSITAVGVITVIPSNIVTVPSATPTLCVNTALTTITHTTTGATGIGIATGLPTGVIATWAADTITISGTPTTIGVFVYDIPLTGGCGTVNATGTITVNPAPTNISIIGTTTTCAGIPVNITLTATPGTQLTWSGTPSTITIGASGSNVISVSPAATTIYEIYSADLNGCTIPVTGQTATVTVSATPQFVNPIADIEICNGGTLNIASLLTSTVPNTDFIWSATTSNVNMAAISGDQTNIDQVVTLINGFQNGTINIEVRPQIGSCFGTSQQILITVKPVPVITSTVSNKTVICNNEFVTLTSNSNPAATLYNWQINTASGVQIVGGATSGTSTTGIVNLQLALTNPLQAGTISFDFTPVNGICTGATITNAVTITVNPIPGTPIGLPINEICSAESTNLTISSFPAIPGTTLVWTVIDSQNVTGFTNGTAAAPFTINDILTNTSDVQGFVKYSVTSRLGNCDGGTTEFIVKVNPLPKPELIDGHICVNQTTGVTYQGYVLDAQLSDPNFTYDWYLLNTTTNVYDALPSTNGPTYEAMQPGTYQVVVTNTVTNCEQSATASVVTVYPATGLTAEVTDAFTEDATITVTVNPVGTGNLIYSLDGGAWQESNIFTGVQGGTHEVMVEDTEGCTNLTTEVLVIDYPKYFTPNGDGIHDTWNIEGLDQPDAKIYIYDRYGKLLKQITPIATSQGWDGTYIGSVMPSTDYWFTIDYKENDQQKQFKAHFSLKR